MLTVGDGSVLTTACEGEVKMANDGGLKSAIAADKNFQQRRKSGIGVRECATEKKRA